MTYSKWIFLAATEEKIAKCTGIHHKKVPLDFVIRNPPLRFDPCACGLRNFKTL